MYLILKSQAGQTVSTIFADTVCTCAATTFKVFVSVPASIHAEVLSLPKFLGSMYKANSRKVSKRLSEKSTKVHATRPTGSMGRSRELLHVLNTNEI